MTENAPLTIVLLFVACTIFILLWLVKKLNVSKKMLLLFSVWLALQAVLARNGFYENFNAIPPRFLLMVLPPIVFILVLFNSSSGKSYLNNLELKSITLIHIVRVPVEIVLFALYDYGLIPNIMTFEGLNFDIFSGLTAPLVYLLILKQKPHYKNIILIWNIVCLILLLIIVALAILSAPSPFQQLSFTQPNIGVFQFPFNWLPSFIVPIVLFAHLVALRILSKK